MYVDEPSIDDAIAILRGLKEKYELFHGVRITDDAIVSAVNLSARYITNRFLPDKAVDLIDEASSSLKIMLENKPPVLEGAHRRIMRLEIEKEALKKELADSVEAIKKREEAAGKLEAKKLSLSFRKQFADNVFEDVDKELSKLPAATRAIHVKKLLAKAAEEIDISLVYCNKEDIKHVQKYKTKTADIPYTLEHAELAITKKGHYFSDYGYDFYPWPVRAFDTHINVSGCKKQHRRPAAGNRCVRRGNNYNNARYCDNIDFWHEFNSLRPF